MIIDVLRIKTEEGEKTVKRFDLIRNTGILGDVKGGDSDRQICLADEDTFSEYRKKGKGLCCTRFMPNITTTGLDYTTLKEGDKFKINNAVIEITSTDKKCFPDCEFVQKGEVCSIKHAVAFAKVVEGGPVEGGDTLSKYTDQTAVWTGEPNPKKKWTRYELLFLPLSWFVFFGGIFWMMALRENKYLYVFALILFFAGLYLIFFRNHHKKRKRRKYSYEMSKDALTIIYTKKKDVEVRQLPLENIRYVAYSIRKNKSGTLYFNFPNDYLDILRMVFANSGLGKFDESIFAFYEIRDAEALLEDLKGALADDVVYEKV